MALSDHGYSFSLSEIIALRKNKANHLVKNSINTYDLILYSKLSKKIFGYFYNYRFVRMNLQYKF